MGEPTREESEDESGSEDGPQDVGVMSKTSIPGREYGQRFVSHDEV